MAKSCVTCGRGSLKGKSRSHSNIATNRQQKINLQSKKIDGKKVNICTSCLRNKKRVKA
jgi:ribosomal protein L28